MKVAVKIPNHGLYRGSVAYAIRTGLDNVEKLSMYQAQELVPMEESLRADYDLFVAAGHSNLCFLGGYKNTLGNYITGLAWKLTGGESYHMGYAHTRKHQEAYDKYVTMVKRIILQAKVYGFENIDLETGEE